MDGHSAKHPAAEYIADTAKVKLRRALGGETMASFGAVVQAPAKAVVYVVWLPYAVVFWLLAQVYRLLCAIVR